jgi:hypothetical protein
VIANKPLGYRHAWYRSVPDYKRVSDTLTNKCFEVEIEWWIAFWLQIARWHL